MNVHQQPHKLSYVEQYLEPVHELLVDDGINELVINPDGAIFIERSGDSFMTPVSQKLSAQAIRRLGAQMAGETKNALGRAHPIVSGRVNVWDQPQRVQVVVEPAVESGVSLSIRKYSRKLLEISDVGFVDGHQVNVDEERRSRHRAIADLADKGALSELFTLAVRDKMNILVSGGTSSGKTTLANALLALCEQQERLVTIEDARELNPRQPNVVSLLADRNDDSQRCPSRLLESTLRMRPDRIVVGEIRGKEAFDFLESINTGHPGAITTIHADSPQLAFDRLAMMVMRSGVPMSHGEILSYAQKTIDLVVQVGRRDGRRGVLEVYLPSLHGAP